MNQSKQNLKELLIKELEILKKSSDHLSYSLKRALHIDLSSKLSESDLEVLDSFSSRFMRAYEILVNQVLRTSLTLMDEKMESKRDDINQGEKFGFFTSYEQIDMFRILRNKVAHEYLEEEWREIYRELIVSAPLLLDNIENTFTQIRSRDLLK